uniref:conjugal transfer protein TraD n=1 Tax=Phytobacter sp. V91 TaxID=3369425 RepID=UPI003F639988
NRLTTAQKVLTRKEKTHRKIVLGGEVAKYLGLDIEQDILVGFLMTFATATKTDLDRYISNGARARQNENLQKEQKNKNSVKKCEPGRNYHPLHATEDLSEIELSEKCDHVESKTTVKVDNFNLMLERRLGKKKE